MKNQMPPRPPRNRPLPDQFVAVGSGVAMGLECQGRELGVNGRSSAWPLDANYTRMGTGYRVALIPVHPCRCEGAEKNLFVPKKCCGWSPSRERSYPAYFFFARARL